MSAVDNSSHNIYLYGGTGANNQLFDDIYVLSLPSFTWTLVFGPGQSPRWGHTCHTAGRQMLTASGASTAGFAAPPCEWEDKGVGVIDLSTMVWESVYNADTDPYTVPAKVLSTISGGNGTAPMEQPADGFNDPQLAQLFGIQHATATSNITTADHKRSDTAAIDGGVAGGAGGAVLIAVLAIMFYRRKPKRRQAPVYPDDRGTDHHAIEVPVNDFKELPEDKMKLELGRSHSKLYRGPEGRHELPHKPFPSLHEPHAPDHRY